MRGGITPGVRIATRLRRKSWLLAEGRRRYAYSQTPMGRSEAAVRAMVHAGILQRAFHDALFPNLAYRIPDADPPRLEYADKVEFGGIKRGTEGDMSREVGEVRAERLIGEPLFRGGAALLAAAVYTCEDGVELTADPCVLSPREAVKLARLLLEAALEVEPEAKKETIGWVLKDEGAPLKGEEYFARIGADDEYVWGTKTEACVFKSQVRAELMRDTWKNDPSLYPTFKILRRVRRVR